jgi:hypothetical protein
VPVTDLTLSTSTHGLARVAAGTALLTFLLLDAAALAATAIASHFTRTITVGPSALPWLALDLLLCWMVWRRRARGAWIALVIITGLSTAQMLVATDAELIAMTLVPAAQLGLLTLPAVRRHVRRAATA